MLVYGLIEQSNGSDFFAFPASQLSLPIFTGEFQYGLAKSHGLFYPHDVSGPLEHDPFSNLFRNQSFELGRSI